MKVNMNQAPDAGPSPGVVPEEEVPEEDGRKPEKAKDGVFQRNKLWIILCVVLLLLFLFINSGMSSTKTGLTIQLKDMKSQTEKFKSATKEAKEVLDEQEKIKANTLSDEEQAAACDRAVQQGELVAKLQNTYKNIDSQTDTEVFEANVLSLEACFDEGDNDAKVPWYTGNKNLPGTWEFASKGSFTGSTAKVLWLCRADDGLLVAYCTASYNADTELFSKANWQMTRYAQANVGTDDTSASTGSVPDAAGGDDISEVTSAIDNIKALVDDGTITPYDEEITEETIERDTQLREARDALKQEALNEEATEGGASGEAISSE